MKLNIRKILLPGFIFMISITAALTVTVYDIGIECIWHRLTRLYCPGCGLTRMVKAVVHGDIYQALRYNPLLFILSPWIMFMVMYLFGVVTFNKKEQKIYETCLIITVVITIMFGILRNLEPFSFLAPIG